MAAAGWLLAAAAVLGAVGAAPAWLWDSGEVADLSERLVFSDGVGNDVHHDWRQALQRPLDTFVVTTAEDRGLERLLRRPLLELVEPLAVEREMLAAPLFNVLTAEAAQVLGPLYSQDPQLKTLLKTPLREVLRRPVQGLTRTFINSPDRTPICPQGKARDPKNNCRDYFPVR